MSARAPFFRGPAPWLGAAWLAGWSLPVAAQADTPPACAPGERRLDLAPQTPSQLERRLACLAVPAAEAELLARGYALEAFGLRPAEALVLLHLPVEDRDGQLIAWQVLLGPPSERQAERAAAADADANRAPGAAAALGPYGPGARPIADAPVCLPAPEGVRASVTINAHRFRHPIRWAEAGPPAWLAQLPLARAAAHQAWDGLGAPATLGTSTEHDGRCAAALWPRALKPMQSDARRLREAVEFVAADGTRRLWSTGARRWLAGDEHPTRFAGAALLGRWADRLRAHYRQPAALRERLAWGERLWERWLPPEAAADGIGPPSDASSTEQGLSPAPPAGAAAAARRSRATPVFILGASAQTVSAVLRPWAQDSACSCCVCWETAIGTVLAYWDDVRFGGVGPWERLLAGDGRDQPSFAALTESIWRASGLACEAGASSWYFNDDVISATQAVVNGQIGYDFAFDFDGWVWFGQDIADEIAVGKPVYYRFSDSASPEPEGWQVTSGHAITVVGVEADSRLLYVYGNWAEVLSHKGFDDADDHGTINITPGGRDCDPAYWIEVPTSCGVGACWALGTLTCPAGFFHDSCGPQAPLAATDTSCDGVDDDCDGAADEDFLAGPSSCGIGVCARQGYRSCSAGHELDSCVPGQPASAQDTSCNGQDDDCDGTADEDYAPVATSCGVGACAATGLTRCERGQEYDSCQALPPLAALDDSCDGVDDDCSGAADEDVAVVATTCGQGACASVGLLRCLGGQLVDSCVPGTGASADTTCNGLDDDCDGLIDDEAPDCEAPAPTPKRGCSAASPDLAGALLALLMWLRHAAARPLQREPHLVRS